MTFPKEVNAEIFAAVSEAWTKANDLLAERQIPADSSIRGNGFYDFNERWQRLLYKLLSQKDSLNRAYHACYDLMMTHYESFNSLGLSPNGATRERVFIDQVCDKVWIPLIMRFAEIPEETRRRYQEDYIKSVT